MQLNSSVLSNIFIYLCSFLLITRLKKKTETKTYQRNQVCNLTISSLFLFLFCVYSLTFPQSIGLLVMITRTGACANRLIPFCYGMSSILVLTLCKTFLLPTLLFISLFKRLVCLIPPSDFQQKKWKKAFVPDSFRSRDSWTYLRYSGKRRHYLN